MNGLYDLIVIFNYYTMNPYTPLANASGQAIIEYLEEHKYKRPKTKTYKKMLEIHHEISSKENHYNLISYLGTWYYSITNQSALVA